MEYKLPKIKHLETFHLRDFDSYNIIKSFPYQTVVHYLHATIYLKSVQSSSKEEVLKYLISIHTFICSLISKGAVNNILLILTVNSIFVIKLLTKTLG